MQEENSLPNGPVGQGDGPASTPSGPCWGESGAGGITEGAMGDPSSSQTGSSFSTGQAPEPPTAKETHSRPISPQKLEANRRNAQRSTGPRTPEGKAKASLNGWKHGLLAQHLFRPGEQSEKDREGYVFLATQIRLYFQPVGTVEELLVEKFVTDSVRYARLLELEQRHLWKVWAFQEPYADRILRYQATANRQLYQTMHELERLQAQRKANSDSCGPSHPGSGNSAPESGNTGPEPATGPEGAARSSDEQEDAASLSSKGADASQAAATLDYSNVLRLGLIAPSS